MASTIDEVARRAAVSAATVSRALRGLPNVSAETRHRILQVAEELDYVIRPQASRALTGRKVVAIVTPLIDGWFYSKVATAATLELSATGFDAVHYRSETAEAQTELIKQLLGQDLIDGCVIVSFPLEQEALSCFKLYRVPLIMVEARSETFPSIFINNVAAAELATRHLINLGHKRIGFISTSKDFTSQDLIPTTRLEGYHRALRQAGIKRDSELELCGNDVYEGGAEAMKTLLSIYEPPTAVFASSDEMAVGALKTLRDLNLRVPDDVSVIGFDDNEVAEYVELTTIRQPVAQFGEMAAAYIARCLTNKMTVETRTAKQDRELPFDLIIRSTTGPLKTIDDT